MSLSQNYHVRIQSKRDDSFHSIGYIRLKSRGDRWHRATYLSVQSFNYFTYFQWRTLTTLFLGSVFQYLSYFSWFVRLQTNWRLIIFIFTNSHLMQTLMIWSKPYPLSVSSRQIHNQTSNWKMFNSAAISWSHKLSDIQLTQPRISKISRRLKGKQRS